MEQIIESIPKRGKRILVMILILAILCTSLPCTPAIPVQAAQSGKGGTWYEISSRINASWGGHITGEITVTNVSSQTRQDWQIAFPWQVQITSMWNGRYQQTGGGYLITPMEYNRELASETSVSVGFLAEGEDSELNHLTEDGFFCRPNVSITDAEERLAEDPILPDSPVQIETGTPTDEPAGTPEPAGEASAVPAIEPTDEPTAPVNPAAEPSLAPAVEPTRQPPAPTTVPSEKATAVPSKDPVDEPAAPSPTSKEIPTDEPTLIPSAGPAATPSPEPAIIPLPTPAMFPTAEPANIPTEEPILSPSLAPTDAPIITPTEEAVPTAEPAVTHIPEATEEPTATPASELPAEPTATSASEQTAEPTATSAPEQTAEPTAEPAVTPAPEPAEDLYIYTDTTLSEDLVCGNLFLMGGSLECSGHSITVQKDYFQNGGDLRLTEADLSVTDTARLISGNIYITKNSTIQIGGDFRAEQAGSVSLNASAMDIRGNLSLDGVNSFQIYEGSLSVAGNMDCVMRESYQQISGELTVGGNLAVSRGSFNLRYRALVEIRGDIRLKEQASMEFWGSNTVPEVSVGGDVVLDTAGKLELSNGSLHLSGDLIQTEQAAENSLRTAGDFRIVLNGTKKQKIETAHPESATLGTLDLRESASVEIPNEIHGKAIHGFCQLQEKERLDLYLSDNTLQQDEEIRCGTVAFHGGNIWAGNRHMDISGNLILDGVNSFDIFEGGLSVSGNMDCAMQGSYQQASGELTVGGNLTVSRGAFQLRYRALVEIRGDIRLKEQGSMEFWGSNTVPEATVGGDLLLDTAGKLELSNGSLHLSGNIIQTEQAAENSLRTAGDFRIVLNGTKRQKIETAHSESATLGTLDLRESATVEIPDELHGKAIHGFCQIQEKERMDLYLSDDTLQQDEQIRCGTVVFHGGNIRTGNRHMDISGNLRLEEVNHFEIYEGGLSVAGNMDCVMQESYQQTSGELTVGGNLTVSRGSFNLRYRALVEIRGDIRLKEQGSMEFWGSNTVPEVAVGGDLLLDTTGKLELSNGSLHLSGNIIQTEQAAENSLRTAGDFRIVLNGTKRQKIETAHSESATLGTLDLRESATVEIPDEIHGKAIHGFCQIQEKEQMDLYLSDDTLQQDEQIRCGTVVFHGGNIRTGNKHMDISGNLRLEEVSHFDIYEGGLSVAGNMDCVMRESYQQTSGELTVGGNLTVSRGSFNLRYRALAEIRGNIRLKEQGSMELWGSNTVPEVAVGGDLLLDTTGKLELSNGSLHLSGDFIQTEHEEAENLRISGEFSLFLCGKQTQTIDLPGIDEIPYLDLSGSTGVRLENDYEGSHLYGLEKIEPKGGILYSYYDFNTVTSDTVLDADFHCGGELDIGDYDLTVNGNFRQKGQIFVGKGKLSVRDNYTAVKGALKITGGSVHVSGNMSIRQNAGLYFNGDPDSHLCVDGNLSTASETEADNCFALGTLEVRGNLTQQPSAGSKSLYMDTTRLVLSGDKKQKVTLQNLAGESYLHDMDLTGSLGVEFVCAGLKAGSITGMERITNKLLTIQDSRLTLQQNELFYGELALVNTYLDCNGYRLHTGGAVTQSDSIVNLDRGSLHVDKDYHIMGNSILQMIRYEDRVYVGGNFAMASSMNHSSMLRNGRMEVMGDFDQSGDVNSFASSEFFTMAFLGSGTHQAHFMEKKSEDKYFANVDPYYNNVEYVSDSISVTTAAIHIGIGMAEGLAEAFLDPTMAVITGAFLAAYGITAALLPTNYVLIGMQLFSVAMVVLSVYSMLKAGDELGDALNGDYSEKEKAEMFGKAAVMLLLAAGAMYGSMAMVMQPKMLRSIVENTRETVRMKFTELKSFVKIFTIRDVDSMALYCEEFVSSPAMGSLKEAMQGCDVKQLQDMAKVVREASKKVGRALTEDELVAAVNNWRENGSITKAVQAAYEWFQNISTYKVRNAFQHLLQQILDRHGITTEEFNHLRLKKVENLNDREVKVLKAIREAIPKGDNNTYFQKVLSAEEIPKYLGEDGYSTIQGFIAKYEDVSHIKTYDDVVESFRLDYVVGGKRPFPEGGDTYGYIKFKADKLEKIDIPFGKKMGGSNIDPPPCTLNGFTGARNGEIIAEWYINKSDSVVPIDGAELHKVVNGKDTIIARYIEDHFE